MAGMMYRVRVITPDQHNFELYYETAPTTSVAESKRRAPDTRQG